MDCLFCGIVNGSIPSYTVYEDKDTLAFLDIGPVSRGHTLVIPKAHSETLSQASNDDAVALMRTVHKLGSVLMEKLGATGYNLGMNHGLDAGQDVFHTHIHLMPRYANDLRRFVKTHPSRDELLNTQRCIVGDKESGG